MSDTKKYEHIKVSSTRDDETVILAGKRGDGSIDQGIDTSSREDDPTPKNRPAKAPDVERAPADLGSDTAANPDTGYDPTTLDDIESSKMPRMQVAVIVIAVIAIAAFVIWYMFFS